MDQHNDLEYYRRREAGARRMAEASSDIAIRRIHTDMADRYAAMIREMTPRARFTIV